MQSSVDSWRVQPATKRDANLGGPSADNLFNACTESGRCNFYLCVAVRFIMFRKLVIIS